MPSTSIQFNEAYLDDLVEIQRFIEERCEQRGSSEDEISDIVLAVNEAVTNIVKHGYGSEPGFLRITVEKVGPYLRVVLLDKGKPFDPNQYPQPDTTLPLEKRAPGGMGIHMMRCLMKRLLYRRTEEGFNELTMEKDCSAAASQ